MKLSDVKPGMRVYAFYGGPYRRVPLTVVRIEGDKVLVKLEQRTKVEDEVMDVGQELVFTPSELSEKQ